MKEVEDSRSPQAKPGPTGVPGFACGKNLYLRSRHQKFVFFYAVQGDEREKDRHGTDVFLIVRVVSVIRILADLESPRAAEHDPDDQ